MDESHQLESKMRQFFIPTPKNTPECDFEEKNQTRGLNQSLLFIEEKHILE